MENNNNTLKKVLLVLVCVLVLLAAYTLYRHYANKQFAPMPEPPVQTQEDQEDFSGASEAELEEDLMQLESENTTPELTEAEIQARLNELMVTSSTSAEARPLTEEEMQAILAEFNEENQPDEEDDSDSIEP